MRWPSQPTPYASAFMARPAWPMHMPSYMLRPLTQLPFMQAQLEELARQHQDIEARELEVQCMSRTLNLNAVRNAVRPELGQLPLLEGASILMGRNRHQSMQVNSWHPSDPKPLRAPPSGIEVISTGVSQIVSPPYSQSGWG